MESTVSCAYCSWAESWTTSAAAKAAGVWHVWDTHPAAWARVVGDRPPDTPGPENFPGRKLESWESQR